MQCEATDDSQLVTEKVYVLVIYTGGTIGMKETPEGQYTDVAQ